MVLRAQFSVRGLTLGSAGAGRLFGYFLSRFAHMIKHMFLTVYPVIGFNVVLPCNCLLPFYQSVDLFILFRDDIMRWKALLCSEMNSSRRREHQRSKIVLLAAVKRNISKGVERRKTLQHSLKKYLTSLRGKKWQSLPTRLLF